MLAATLETRAQVITGVPLNRLPAAAMCLGVSPQMAVIDRGSAGHVRAKLGHRVILRPRLPWDVYWGTGHYAPSFANSSK